MLQQALNRHSRVAVPPETAFFTFLGLSKRFQAEHLERINADLQIALPIPSNRVRSALEARALYEEIERCYLERLGKCGVTHFGEKSPEHQRRLDRIHQVFPEAKILLIYRDGRDVACSLRKLPFMSSDLFVNFALWLHYYRLQKRAQKSGRFDLLCVRYEDVVRSPESEFSRILEFLELPAEPYVVEGHGNSSGIPTWEYPWKARALERISTARIGLWRQELSMREITFLERWGGNVLKELGYELTTAATERLPWWFFPRLFWRSAKWLASKGRFGAARRKFEPQLSA